MSGWQLTVAFVMAGVSTSLLWNISAKLDEIARLLREKRP